MTAELVRNEPPLRLILYVALFILMVVLSSRGRGGRGGPWGGGPRIFWGRGWIVEGAGLVVGSVAVVVSGDLVAVVGSAAVEEGGASR